MATMTLARATSPMSVYMDDEYKVGQSAEAKTVLKNYESAFIHYASPITSPKSTAFRFYDLFYKWKFDTITASSPTVIAMHPAYQEIIGMGSAALPYIFKELTKQTDYWFWALKAITGRDPVSLENRGRIEKMRQEWLVWAKGNAYL